MANDVTNASTSEFVASFVINMALGIILFLVFCLVRRRYPWLYDIRRFDRIRNPNYRPGEFYLARPPRQPDGYISWFKTLFAFTEDDISTTAGLDAIMTLRFAKWFGGFFIAAALLASAVLIPIHVVSSNDSGLDVIGFDRLSFASIPDKSHRAIANLVIMYVFTFGLFYVMYRLWLNNIQLQTRWLANETFAGRRLTVMLKHIPEHLRDDDKLTEYFDKMFPGQVCGCSMVKDVSDIRKLFDKTNKLANWANHDRGVMEMDFKNNHKRILHQTKVCGGDETKVDSIEFATKQYDEAMGKMETLLNSPHNNYTVGFVKFNSAVAASSAMNIPLQADSVFFSSTWAPEPREIIWGSVMMNPYYRQVMIYLMHLIHFFLVFFYTIPIAFVSSIISLESLTKRLSFLEPINDLPKPIVGFLQGFLPALAMIIFMALLPIILRAMAVAQGEISETDVQKYIFKKYFVFQLFNFFLITAFAQSFLEEIDNIISDPGSIPNLLATSLPQSSTFFISYIMLRGVFSNFLDLIDIVRVIIGTLLKFFASTPLELMGAWNPDPFKYGKFLPEALLIAIIGYCFSIIQPIILPFTGLFFITFYFLHKHHYIYVHVTPFETGGAFWPLIFNRMIIGMIISQLCVIGMFGLKKIPIEAAFSALLPFLTIAFYYYCDTYLAPKMNTIHLHNAVVNDAARSSLTSEEVALLDKGHELASPGDDILPLLMPDIYSDSLKNPHAHDKPLSYHYLSDGAVYSTDASDKEGVPQGVPLESNTSCGAEGDLELGQIADAPLDGNEEESGLANSTVNSRGLTNEQEHSLKCAAYRALNNHTKVTRLTPSETTSEEASDSNAESEQEIVQDQSNCAIDVPVESETPAIAHSLARSADDPMAKYTQQELALDRYGIKLSSHIWAPEYIEYKQRQFDAKMSKKNKNKDIPSTPVENDNKDPVSVKDEEKDEITDVAATAAIAESIDPENDSLPENSSKQSTNDDEPSSQKPLNQDPDNGCDLDQHSSDPNELPNDEN